MTARMGLSTRVVPWDDREFVRAFEKARAELEAEGLTINGPKAAARAQQLLRAAGYPLARIEVERTIDEAMVHAARWTVLRDGPQVQER
jgi:hypothetical protein